MHAICNAKKKMRNEKRKIFAQYDVPSFLILHLNWIVIAFVRNYIKVCIVL